VPVIGRDNGRPGEVVSGGHRVEEGSGLGEVPRGGVGLDESVVGADVSGGHLIEHIAGVEEGPAF